MAQGDLTMFEETLVAMGEGGLEAIDFESDTFKMSLVVAGTTPTAADPVPAYSGGTTNFNGAAEVSNAGSYTDGGNALANPSWTEVGGAVTFDADDPAAWTANASNSTDAKWAIIYDDSTTIKYAICFIDLGTAFDMTGGSLTVNLAATGVFVSTIGASV